MNPQPFEIAFWIQTVIEVSFALLSCFLWKQRNQARITLRVVKESWSRDNTSRINRINQLVRELKAHGIPVPPEEP